MINHYFHLDFLPNRGLQEQLKEALINAILMGVFPHNEPLPSCRTLATQLNISRNTVALVYERLVADNYLISKVRSGYYLHPDYVQSTMLATTQKLQHSSCLYANLNNEFTPKWESRLKHIASDYIGTMKPSNWSEFKYPFIYGQIDTHYFPLNEWRQTTKQILGGERDRTWLTDYIDRDDPYLIEQIRTRVLPKRGIMAKADEILITLGSQNALYLIANLLFNQKTKVAIETPGYIDAFNIAKIHQAQIIHQSVDSEGIIIDEKLSHSDYIYVTPSHQVPTGVMMSKERRKLLLNHANHYDQIIIEDDYDAEIRFSNQNIPALKSEDRSNRIIYMSSFSKVLSPGLRIGYIVADSELIEELKALRRLMYRHPPANIQYQLAQFLAQGYYDRYLKQYSEEMKCRWDLMNEAIDAYLPESKINETEHSSSFWLQSSCPRLCWKASQNSILIESGDQNYFNQPITQSYFRMGFTAIKKRRIKRGIQKLANIIHNIS